MASHKGFIIFSFIVLFLFSLGVYNYLTDFETNRCNMTYMYEYPQLIRISLPENDTLTYRKYGLYVYAEGRFIEKARAMKFKGIPVVFIPGNRGSPKQIRSLASVSLRKSLSGRTPYHFDYFALDFNEELSGLFGGFLEDQTKFARICIKTILSLYKTNKPNSVVLIGHSMGGMIAKALFLDPSFDSKQIKIIVTLATPHKPALMLDYLMADYYDEINKHWDNATNLKEHINLISIGGGARDLLVRANHFPSPQSDINITAPQIPDVWLSVDHLCILWCKELVLVITRSLFDSVDLKTKQISDDANKRRDIFKYHLLDRSGSKKYHLANYQKEVPLHTSSSTVWIEMEGQQMTWFRNGSDSVVNILIPMQGPYDTVAVSVVNHKARDWLFVCANTEEDIKICKIGINLSNLAKISPNAGVKKKTALISLSEYKDYTHFVVRSLPSHEIIEMSIDLFSKKSRELTPSTNYLMPIKILKNNQHGSLYYNINLTETQSWWQVYRVKIESSNCTLPSLAESRVNIPWTNDGATYLASGSKGSFPVKISSSKPAKERRNVNIDVFLNPKCSYTIKIEKPFLLTLGTIVAKYGLSVFTYATVCLLLALAYQIKSLGENGSCPLLHFVLHNSSKPYVVVQATALVSAIGLYLSKNFPLPAPDSRNSNGLIELVFIPLFLYLSAFALLYVASTALVVLIVFQGQAYNGILLKFLNRFFFGLAWLSEFFLSGANKIPVVVSMFMITVCYTSSGGLATVIGLGFYFFKMISLYEDFWEEIVYWPLKLLKAKIKQRTDRTIQTPTFQIPPIDEFSYHLTLMLLWAIVAIIDTPSVLVWAKNYRYDSKLEPDPSFTNSVLMALCASILWQTGIPINKLMWSKYLSQLIYMAAVIVMAYGHTSLYRISFVITCVFVLITLHQAMAPWLIPEDNGDDRPGPTDDCELKSQLAQIFQKSALDLEDCSDDQKEGEKEEVTPGDDSSTSSFEQILDKEISSN